MPPRPLKGTTGGISLSKNGYNPVKRKFCGVFHRSGMFVCSAEPHTNPETRKPLVAWCRHREIRIPTPARRQTAWEIPHGSHSRFARALTLRSGGEPGKQGEISPNLQFQPWLARITPNMASRSSQNIPSLEYPRRGTVECPECPGTPKIPQTERNPPISSIYLLWNDLP